MARVSNLSQYDNSISVVVQLDQGTHAYNHSIYIFCSNGASSTNLGGYPIYNSGATHWSRAATFYNLSPGTSYTFTASSSSGSVTPGTWSTTGTYVPPGPPPTTSARVSDVAIGNDYIEAVVLLNQGADASRHVITLSCNGQTSPDLGYPSPTGNSHWSRSYTFYGLEPGTSHTITGSVSGLSYVTPLTKSTTGVARPPAPLVQQHSASGKDIYMSLLNWYTGTQVAFKLSGGSWTSWQAVSYNAYGPFTTDEYAQDVVISVKTRNLQGQESQEKLAYAYSQPRVPTLRNPEIANNEVTFEVYTEGYWSYIEVDHYLDGGATKYITKRLDFNGSRPYTGRISFGALVKDARYQFRAIAYKSGQYNSGYGGWAYIQNSTVPTKPAMRHYSSRGTAITVIVDDTYDATQIRLKPSWSSTWSTYPVGPPGTTYTFYADQYGTEYTIAAIGVNAIGDSETRLSNVMTEPRVPSLNDPVAINNTISVNVSVVGGFDSIRVEMHDQFAEGEIAYRISTSRNFTATFSNLVPGAIYRFRAISYKTASYPGNYSPSSGYGGWLPVQNNFARPENWRWLSATNSNGHKEPGVIFSLTDAEWNAFAERVNAFRKYKALPEVTLTRAVRGRDVQAVMFNQMRAAIDEMRGTGLGSVATRNKIFASYFNALMNAINGIT